MADALPEWAVADVAVLPVRVQPVKPCSNPPLVMPLVGAGVTVSETVVLCVALGEVPVTVIGYVPGVVVASTLNVSVELVPVVTEDGLRLVLVPDGAPVAVSEIVSAAPLVMAVEIVEVPEPPWAIETLVGFALIEKSFATGAVTVSVTVVPCVALVPVPVIVTGYVPGAVLASTVKVSVELVPEVIGLGLKAAVVPAGTPVAERLTLCAEPLVVTVEIVDVAVPPCAAETLDGFALIEKSFGGGVPPHPGSVNVPIRVRQLKVPFVGMYSLVYQNVQPSTGSTVIAL